MMLETLSKELGKRGLPKDPTQVIGRPFLFGDNEHCIGGTVFSVGYGPEEGIILYITSPRFRGGDIRRLVGRDGQWIAACTDGSEKPGQLMFL